MRLSHIMIALALTISSAGQCSFDLADLLQPGSPSDVLSAGLDLPSVCSLAPAADRPLSLLMSPSSFAAAHEVSKPYRKTGSRREMWRSSSTSGLLHIRRENDGCTVAGGFEADWNSASSREDGRVYTRSCVSTTLENVALAWERRGLMLGLSVSGAQRDGDVRSTRMSSLEPQPGSGVGVLELEGRQSGFAAELARQFGRGQVGALVARDTGDMRADAFAAGQGYSAEQDVTELKVAPYAVWKRGNATRAVLANALRVRTSGPVLVGRLLAGELHGGLRRNSVAGVWREDSGHRTTMCSLEASSVTIDAYGRAGGFLLPGLFNAPIYTRNHLRLDSISARYGIEQRRGNASLRYSILLTCGILDYRLYANQARWMQPLKILTDDRLDHAGMIAISPAAGLGYRTRDWQADLGLSLYAALLTKSPSGISRGSSPSGHRGRSRMLPGYRWGVTVRRAL